MPQQPEQFQGPHQGQPVYTAGQSLDEASSAMIMIHGRGASAQDILTLSAELNQPDIAYLAPQAAGYAWYPNSFLAPIASNEPGLSSALVMIKQLLARVEEAGIPAEKTFLLGFSQGACLTLEFAARNAQRYGGIFGLSGGLIGPNETPRDYDGAFGNTPIFLGCSTTDFHIPAVRVDESAQVLTAMGAQVDKRLYPNMGHTINLDEIEAVRAILTTALSASA